MSVPKIESLATLLAVVEQTYAISVKMLSAFDTDFTEEIEGVRSVHKKIITLRDYFKENPILDAMLYQGANLGGRNEATTQGGNN